MSPVHLHPYIYTTERQVIPELLAFSEVIQASGTVILVTGKHHATLQTNVLFCVSNQPRGRNSDCTFTSTPTMFSSAALVFFRGGTRLSGLLVLYSVLNMDYTHFYQRQLGSKFSQCGWAEALKRSGATFRHTLEIQKKSDTPPSSLNSSEHNTPNKEDSITDILLSQLGHSKRAKTDNLQS